MPAKVVLEVLSGPIQGQTYSFEEHDTFLFGREKDCHARLKGDEYASRHHFIVEVNPPAVRLRDLGSLNGTHVNGVRHGGRAPHERPEDAAGRDCAEVDLKHGDVIAVGDSSILVHVELPAECSQCGRAIPNDDIARAQWMSGSLLCVVCRGQLKTQVLPRPADAERQSTGGGERETLAIEGYDLAEELGRGGMGVVYKAVSRADGSTVAVKYMLAKAAKHELFLREIEVTRQLRHQHLVRLREHGAAPSGFYFILDYCNGGNLLELVRRRGSKMSVKMLAPVMLQCLDGLAHAHQAGFVHRDLKPQNILLDQQQGKWTAKISDFGLAKNYELAGMSGMTITGSHGGTYPFMPREQLTQYKYVRPVSDLWSLAATFYLVLTGATPLDFPDERKAIETILRSDAVPIRRRDPSIPAAVAAVIDRALATVPESRFASASEMRAALASALG